MEDMKLYMKGMFVLAIVYMLAALLQEFGNIEWILIVVLLFALIIAIGVIGGFLLFLKDVLLWAKRKVFRSTKSPWRLRR